jgi:hypothetical protein
MRNLIAASILLTLAASSCVAWNGHEVKAGSLKALIEEVATVTQLDTPIPVTVTLENTGPAELSGTAEVRDCVDNSRVVGDSTRAWKLAPGAKTQLAFALSFGPGTYSALYPVHVYLAFTENGQAQQAHAVRIITTQFPGSTTEATTTPGDLKPIVVPERGAVSLTQVRDFRMVCQYFDQPERYFPAGFTGSDPVSRASLGISSYNRGETRVAVNMHPPWTGGVGTVYAEYALTLPNVTPIKLTFATAIRDSAPTEPLSDGVRFRVWAGEKVLYDRFHASKTWLPGEADLSAFAGKTVLLRLESDPGPARNTTCDSSYWAEPTLVAGPQADAKPLDYEQAAAAARATAQRLLTGTLKPNGRYTFVVGEGNRRVAAIFTPSSRGLLDGALTLVGSTGAVTFQGFVADIMGQHAVQAPTSVAPGAYEVRLVDGKAVHTHHLTLDGKPADFTLTLWTEGDGLRIAFDCPQRITDFALGPANQTAPAVYYGHGYRIVNPRPFRAGFGGHNLSTSHVGCDFADGLSVLQATDVPPDYFEVTPDARRYSLHTHSPGTLTLVAGGQGALDCAIRYRPLYDKQPAGGVQRLAGRMCFDIWGGRYGDIADRMAEMIRYGLTDSFLTVHNWQRWGYDYRLPDIWPPNPAYGTVEDMQRIAQVCGAKDIPWGLHDNYIDFYPDATGYTYDDICFTTDGRPIKAWLNEGREAQSYRWRPDKIMPFIERNMKLVKEGVAPTHYFLDVFTSTSCFDFYDKDGNFHPNTETRRRFGEAFAYIRDTLGGNAPTTSEAGHDQLIGYLDGADCQHLFLTDQPNQEHTIRLACDSWERVPWFDAVNHGRFILHGVGYSIRYEGSRGRNDHGIMSDDYISAEILEGHALMVDSGCWGAPAVRKYWLAQDVARNLSLKAITNVEYAGGDMRRQIVTWDNGTKVYVNRGEDDWSVEGRVLPQYGFLVVGTNGLQSAVERRDGVYSESSCDSGHWYCNARAFGMSASPKIGVHVENFRYLGGDQFSWDVVWQADRPAPRDMRVFTHFYGQGAKRRDKIVFQDDHEAAQPPKAWNGTVRYTRTITVPEGVDGQLWAAIGLYDSAGRLPLKGTPLPTTDTAVWVGTLKVERADGKVVGLTLDPPAAVAPVDEPDRANTDGKALDFGFAVTDGAFRVEQAGATLRVIPLPNSPAFGVTLRLKALGVTATPKELRAVAEDGTATTLPLALDDDLLSFRHDGKSFCYEVVF